MLLKKKKAGRELYIDMKNPNGEPGMWEDHPDGHKTPGPEHHNGEHIHVKDQNGDEHIIRYGKNKPSENRKHIEIKDLEKDVKVPAKKGTLQTVNGLSKAGKGLVKASGKAFLIGGIAAIGCSVADAAPSERKDVIKNEISSFAGALAGGLLCPASPLLGGVLGGFVASAINGYFTEAEKERKQEEEQERKKKIQFEKKWKEDEIKYQEAKRKLQREKYLWDLYFEVQSSEPGKDLQYYTEKMDQIIEERLKERGGIILSGTVDVCSKMKFNVKSIDQIFLDNNGNIILVSKQDKVKVSSPGIDVNEEDLLVALAVIYNGLEISFSLDPWDPLNPDCPYQQKVFYPKALSITKLGDTMFVTDYYLKKMSFGTVQLPKNITCEMDHLLNQVNEKNLSNKKKEEWSRMWIVVDKVSLNINTIEKDGEIHQCLEFGDVKMRACSKRMVVDLSSPSGLSDCEEKDDLNSASQKFAREFTLNYDSVAKMYPEFERLRNLAKVVSLAKFLYDNKVQIDLDTILNSLQKRGIKTNEFINVGPVKVYQHKKDEEKVPKITYSKTKALKNMTYTQKLIGGIDLKSNLKCNVKKTNQLPKDFSKQFLESISKDSYKYIQSKQIKMPNGNNAFVLPLFLISRQTLINKDLLIGESLVNRNPLKSLEIASFYTSLDEKIEEHLFF